MFPHVVEQLLCIEFFFISSQYLNIEYPNTHTKYLLTYLSLVFICIDTPSRPVTLLFFIDLMDPGECFRSSSLVFLNRGQNLSLDRRKRPMLSSSKMLPPVSVVRVEGRFDLDLLSMT